MRGGGSPAFLSACVAWLMMAWLALLCRYDHYSVLCELLPVGIPSLAICLQTLVNGEPPSYCHAGSARYLGILGEGWEAGEGELHLSQF